MFVPVRTLLSQLVMLHREEFVLYLHSFRFATYLLQWSVRGVFALERSAGLQVVVVGCNI